MSLPPQKRRHLAIKWRFATLRLLIRKRFRILAIEWQFDRQKQARNNLFLKGRIGAQITEKCVTDQIVQHEMLHIIGLYHEHNRYDRDKYIKVHYENVLPDLKLNRMGECVTVTQDLVPFNGLSVILG
ncbi:hypothetical protein KIN20_029744 [Parelaphostrongylus tenuis]|uniref:Metalloendopeptidase n=1 Tax=Parelaphostrongylus tenuis TaxID=148309 RepID=A0AAD5MEK9_PARTN|nr:hypothetical protein KIN20_015239 [Parelaphostrongylus tenuis]KAJ1368586.1 hypothetical protein KIN20_029744 [Parelaphostrongylus tenuis]